MTEKDKLLQGYKETPLGIIPQDWKVLRLGDLCHNTGEYGLNAPAIDYSKNMPTYLRITDIDGNGKFRTEDIKSVNSPIAKDYYLKNGDIVFARTGATVGKTYLYNIQDGQLVYAGFLIKFSPNNKKLLPYYLKIYTETKMYWNWVTVASQRSGQPGINASEYCSFKMIVPPIEEQKKIIEVLSEWDKAIELQTKLIGKLELRKRALMQRLLTGRVRLNGFSEKWEKKKLDEIGTVYNGLSGKNKDDFEKGNSHFITYMNIFSNECIKKDMLGKVNIAQKEQQNRVQYGDIFFTVSSETPKEVGMTSVLLQDLADTYLNSFCFGFRPYNFNTLLPHFAMYFFRSSEFRKKMYTIAQGSTRYNIGKSDVLGMNICIPPIAEQHIIAEVLSTADKEIEIAKNKLSSLCHQKRGLMQQLLTGKKRIKL